MSKSKDLFDSIIDALVHEGAEGGTYTLSSKEKKGVTYLLMDASDRAFGDMNVQVYAIDSADEFITKLRDKLGEEEIDPWDDDVNAAVWEVLNRYEVVHFDEF
jgi:hypothetical protein